MLRVDAALVVAGVHDDHAWRNRAVRFGPRQPMGIPMLAPLGQLSVATVGEGSLPLDAVHE